MDAERHQSVTYTTDVYQAQKAVNESRFRSMKQIGQDVYEITAAKKRLTVHQPIYVALFVLCAAKLQQLKFVYDSLFRYVDRRLFTTVLTDTDSICLDLARSSLEECLIPEKREEFMKMIYGNCSEQRDPKCLFQRLCCSAHFQNDKREPG